MQAEQQIGLFEASLDNGALLSEDGRYRYRLWRIWEPANYRIVWVLLNPSTADASVDDPTLRRCIGFARRWQAGGVTVVNLFAARATDPRELLRMDDPVGPENDKHIMWACNRQPVPTTVVFGWGAGGRPDRVHMVEMLCSSRGHPWCLGTTKAGHPRHPLYVAASTPLESYRGY